MSRDASRTARRTDGAHAATAPATDSAATAAPECVAVDSRDLFRHGNTVVIAHAGQRYILRLTRDNKLILTK